MLSKLQAQSCIRLNAAVSSYNTRVPHVGVFVNLSLRRCYFRELCSLNTSCVCSNEVFRLSVLVK
jgi:hypothetical protein